MYAIRSYYDIADTVLVSLQAAGAGAPNPDPQALVESLRSVVTDLSYNFV